MKNSLKGRRKSNFRELKPSRFKPIKFNAGNIEKKLTVKYEHESDLEEIEFSDIKSSVTRKNLLKLKTIYNIEWNKIIRYPVNGRYGYIIEGLMRELHKVTYIRKEIHSRGSGSTDMWFDNGYMIPATKLLRANLMFNDTIEYWGQNVKEEAVNKWIEITGDQQILMSYKLSKIVHGNKNKKEQSHKYPEEVISWIVRIAKKLDYDDFLRLVAEIQKVQFERI